MVEDGISGSLVPPGDPAALARRIGDALSSGPGRVGIGLHGRERVRAEFTFEPKAARCRELLAALAGRPGLECPPPAGVPHPGVEK